MRDVARLTAELKAAKDKEAKAKIQCQFCDGVGSFLDTTYDRSGVDMPCDHCFGTGLPADQVRIIIQKAFAPFREAAK